MGGKLGSLREMIFEDCSILTGQTWKDGLDRMKGREIEGPAQFVVGRPGDRKKVAVGPHEMQSCNSVLRWMGNAYRGITKGKIPRRLEYKNTRWWKMSNQLYQEGHIPNQYGSMARYPRCFQITR